MTEELCPENPTFWGNACEESMIKIAFFFPLLPSVFRENNLTVSRTGRDVRVRAGASSNNEHSQRIQRGRVIQHKHQGKSSQEP